MLRSWKQNFASEAVNESNANLLLLTLVVFCFQQLVEFFVLQGLGKNYADLCRWDCGYYALIVDGGYGKIDVKNEYNATLAFFPLFPLMAFAFKKIFLVSTQLALVLTSKIFFLSAIFAFVKMTKKYFPQVTALTAALVVAFNPYAIYANAGYTESLFLFLTCGFFFYLRENKYLKLATCAMFLGVTRLVGVAVFLSYFLCIYRNFFKSESSKKIIMILAAMLMVSGFSIYMIFLHFFAGDALAFIHVSKFWGRVISNPINTLIDGFFAASIVTKIFAATALMGFLGSLYLFYKKYYDLGLFLLCGVLLALSSGVLASMPRYLWFQAPFLLLCARLSNGWSLALIILCFLPIMIFMYCAWFSGLAFVV